MFAACPNVSWLHDHPAVRWVFVVWISVFILIALVMLVRVWRA